MEETSLVLSEVVEEEKKPWVWGQGKPPGVKNKLTKKFRDDLLWVLERANGRQRLLNMCKIGKNRNENLWRLYELVARNVPKELINIGIDNNKGTTILQINIPGDGNGNGNEKA